MKNVFLDTNKNDTFNNSIKTWNDFMFEEGEGIEIVSLVRGLEKWFFRCFDHKRECIEIYGKGQEEETSTKSKHKQ